MLRSTQEASLQTSQFSMSRASSSVQNARGAVQRQVGTTSRCQLQTPQLHIHCTEQPRHRRWSRLTTFHMGARCRTPTTRCMQYVDSTCHLWLVCAIFPRWLVIVVCTRARDSRNGTLFSRFERPVQRLKSLRQTMSKIILPCACEASYRQLATSRSAASQDRLCKARA
jgi:hypothetical protein